MNKILKGILLTAKDIALEGATSVVPGSALVIAGAQRLLDHDDANNGAALEELGAGVVQAVDALDPSQIDNPALVQVGLQDLQRGIAEIKRGLKA